MGGWELRTICVPKSLPEEPFTMSENQPAVGTARVKRGMAEMLKGGVIMDVVTPEQAKIAEDAGAVAVMGVCLHAVPVLVAHCIGGPECDAGHPCRHAVPNV